jgi:twitching motility two-component system response regulator PilG
MEKVLIVDDDSKLLNILKKGLQKYVDQFEVLTASDGEEAIEVLKRERISVLVTDLVMPKVSGLELLTYMNQNHPHIPCIVITAHGNPEFRERAAREDVLGYIEKPFDSNELAWEILDRLDRFDENSYPKGMSVNSLLLLTEMEKKTCLLEINFSGKRKGLFYFNKGVLYDALYSDLKGEDAALEMIGWDHVDFQFKDISKEDQKRRINRGLMPLIMEGTRFKDKAIGAGNEVGSAEVVKTEKVSEQKRDSSLQDQAEEKESELISEAVSLAEGHHFQQSQKVLARLLRINPRNCEGWLWCSRVLGSMKAIKSSLKNAATISSKDPLVVLEIEKLNLAENKVWTDRVWHCPFCWSPLEEKAGECYYCEAHLFIHEQFFTSKRTANQGIINKAIERYEKVIKEEKNADAHYYLAMAYLNMENWAEAFDQLQKSKKLAPENKAFIEQLNALQSYMDVMGMVYQKKISDLSKASKGVAKGNKILVAEDSSDTRKLIVRILSRKGYAVLEAKDGLEALSQLNNEKPDLVMLDIVMPRMDGYKVLSIMKDSAIFKDIPVIILTGKDKVFDKIKGKMSGASSYLTKPFNPAKLIDTINKCLR